jgi:dedicator of cytokinesis protein 3
VKLIDLQVRVIGACLKLHRQLCSQDYISFHEKLEKDFKRNFRDEIRRLAIDTISNSDQITVSASVKSDHALNPSQYQPSAFEPSLKRSLSTASTSRPPQVPLLQLGRPVLTPPPPSPQSPRDPDIPGSSKTPLQRHLAHLARHGINGVTSGPKDNGGSDSLSAESPQESFVNVGNGVHGVSASQVSGTSVVNSIRSMGSIKGRFSRFGSLNFGRRRGS